MRKGRGGGAGPVENAQGQECTIAPSP